MRLLLILTAALLSCSALAGRCEAELSGAAERLPADLPLGVFAAEMLTAAVELVEPALPPLAWVAEEPLPADAAGAGAAAYLAERELLPAAWDPVELSRAAWDEMLSRFLAWYGLAPFRSAGAPDRAGVITDLAEVLDRVAAAVRPVALIAPDARNRSQLAFVGVVWNWSVYPRLLVLKPDPSLTLERGVRGLLPRLGNCAVRMDRFVSAPADVARALFLGSGVGRMYIVGSEPASEGWPLLVEAGAEPDYFGYLSGDVAGLEVYAAVFEGEALGPVQLMRLLPRVRTNLPPAAILGLLQTPH